MNSIYLRSVVGRWFTAQVLLLMVGVAPALLGQQTSGNMSDQSSDANNNTTEQTASPSAQAAPTPPPLMYSGSLFGSQPIAVELWQPAPRTAPPVQATGPDDMDTDVWTITHEQASRYLLLYGLRAAANYQEMSGGQGGSGYVGTVTPYLGLLGRTRTGFWLFQYAPTIVPYTPLGPGLQGYHSVAFSAAGSLTRTLSWGFSMVGGYGSEAAIIGAPLPTREVVSGVSITDPSAATILPFNGNMLDTSETLTLAWKLNAKQTLGLNLGDTYFAFSRNSGGALVPTTHTDDAHTGLDFGQMLSSRTTLHAYATADRIYGNSISPCSFYGGGLGISVAATKTITLAAGAGPEASSASCGRGMGANFHGTLTAALAHHMTAYVSAQRGVATAFRMNSLWEDSATAGIAKSLRSVSLGFDGGYYHGQTLASAGYFVSPHVDYGLRIAKFTSVGAGYRRYHSNTPLAGGGDIGYFFASLTFAPGGTLRLQK